MFLLLNHKNRASTMSCQHDVESIDVVSTRRVKATPCQHDVLSKTCFFLLQIHHRANMMSCQCGAMPTRHVFFETSPSKDGAVSKTLSCQRNVRLKAAPCETMSCQNDGAPRRCRPKTMSSQDVVLTRSRVDTTSC